MTDHEKAIVDRVGAPGFTPGVRDVPEILVAWRALVATAAKNERSKITQRFVRALGRGDRGVGALLIGEFHDAPNAEKALYLRILSRISARFDLAGWRKLLSEALAAPDPQVVRAALRAVGDLADGHDLEHATIGHLQHAGIAEQRAAAEALGKVGGQSALAALRTLVTDDPELQRRCAEAIALLERRELRERRTTVLTDVPLPDRCDVRLRCRPGAEEFLRDQASAVLGPAGTAVAGGLEVPWTGTLGALRGVRIALDAGLVFDLTPGTDDIERITTSLRAEGLVAALRAWTDGPLRFRLSFADQTSRRSVVKGVAAALRAHGAALANDSRSAPWKIEIDTERNRILCVPREDKRFDYRKAHLAASSHPTLAALMAWVARPRPQEVIWDPFCGAASELIECAMLEPTARLYGTDRSADAVRAAHENLAAAALTADIRRADALQTALPEAPSLIITNPPMGRRVSSGHGVHDLLRRFVHHAARTMATTGRLVWVSPAAHVSAEAGQEAGFQVEDHGPLDLGGLRVHLQVMSR